MARANRVICGGKWFSDAARSLSLRTKVMDCSVAEALSLARNHTQFVCYRDSDDTPSRSEWLAVLGASRRRFQVLVTGDSANDRDFRQ